MKRFVAALGAAALLGAGSGGVYRIDTTRYFASSSAESASREALFARAQQFLASAPPPTAKALVGWLEEYDALLASVERHDIYVYLHAEENDSDTADARADDALGQLEDRLSEHVAAAVPKLGSGRVGTLVRDPALAPYRYLLTAAFAGAQHRLTPSESRALDLAVTPVLDAAEATYKRLRKSSDSIAANEQAYAALLVSIAAARNGVAKLRGFGGAAEASYFDKAITTASVDRILSAVRGSPAYANYQRVAALAPKPRFSPAPISVEEAIPVILAAEQPMGAEYAGAYAALLDARDGRLEICTAEACDRPVSRWGFMA